MEIEPNALFKADCSELLQRLNDQAVDLVYLDPPPFPSATLNQSTDDVATPQLRLISHVCQHAHRSLKETGHLYFHTSPAAAFNVQLILNQVFGEKHFRGEIVWQHRKHHSGRTAANGHDTILCYSKSDRFTENPMYRPLTTQEVRAQYKDSDEGGPYALADLTAPIARPNLQFRWKGFVPPPGRSWRFTEETLSQLEKDGRIYQPPRSRIPRLKRYLSEHEGVEVGTIWTDIPLITPASPENTKYPLQKPLGVVERLLLKSSVAGNVVLDPFCGSGTTLVAAERHHRRWIGCDISAEAIELSTKRLLQELPEPNAISFSVADQEALQQISIKPLHYGRPIAVRLKDFEAAGHVHFVLNQPVTIEETRHFEFKEIRGGSPVDSIVNTADEYAVAFLNSEGGRIYWGIRDRDRVAVGVRLSYAERDKIRRDVTAKLNQIDPHIDPSQYRIEIHGILDRLGSKIPDVCIVELVVPEPKLPGPYYTGGGDAWVKVDGNKQKLKGSVLTAYIKNKCGL